MRLPGRVQATIDILDQIERQHRPLHLALKEWGANHRFAGAKDRRFIAALASEALRFRGVSRWLFQADTSRADCLGAMVLGWFWSVDDVAAAFDGTQFAGQLLSVHEQACLTKSDVSHAPIEAQLSMPQWLAEKCIERFGEAQALVEAQAFMRRPPLDLRVNPEIIDRHTLAEKLEDYAPVLPNSLPLSLRLSASAPTDAPPRLETMGVFLKGGFEVQDGGSQALAQLAAHYKPKRVLDFCAGGGGKALALKVFLGQASEIHLYDKDPRRLAGSFERINRVGEAGFSVHEPRPSKAGLPKSLTNAEAFDLVVIDAPCTGSGVWRRKPQTKWKLTPDFVNTCHKVQLDILTQASRFVGEEGGLAYMTCSWLQAENDDTVAKFLSQNADFGAVKPELLATWPPLDRLPFWLCEHGIMLTPAKSQTDGFYFAYLKRESR